MVLLESANLTKGQVFNKETRHNKLLIYLVADLKQIC